MNTVLYFSASGAIYETGAYSKADIDQLVHEQGLQCLTSAPPVRLWFTTSRDGCQRLTNQSATELLLATTTFTAKTVPLLRGCIVVATHDCRWRPRRTELAATRTAGSEKQLTDQGRRACAQTRIVRDDRRRQKRTAEGAQPASVSCARPRTPARH